jgi:hypothetical protein
VAETYSRFILKERKQSNSHSLQQGSKLIFKPNNSL